MHASITPPADSLLLPISHTLSRSTFCFALLTSMHPKLPLAVIRCCRQDTLAAEAQFVSPYLQCMHPKLAAQEYTGIAQHALAPRSHRCNFHHRCDYHLRCYFHLRCDYHLRCNFHLRCNLRHPILPHPAAQFKKSHHAAAADAGKCRAIAAMQHGSPSHPQCTVLSAAAVCVHNVTRSVTRCTLYLHMATQCDPTSQLCVTSTATQCDPALQCCVTSIATKCDPATSVTSSTVSLW